MITDLKIDYESIRKELQQAEPELLKWNKKQNNYDDKLTDFIYHCDTFVEFNRIFNIANSGGFNINREYALNRWFNYISSKTIESIFCLFEGVKAEENIKHKAVDIHIQDFGNPNKNQIKYDIKLSVFPEKLIDEGKTPIDFLSRSGKNNLIRWLYQNQSYQKRFHMQNRLFIIVYSNEVKNNYSLKYQFEIIEEKIKKYFEYIKKDPIKNTNKLNVSTIHPIKKTRIEQEVYSDLLMIHM